MGPTMPAAATASKVDEDWRMWFTANFSIPIAGGPS
jgi:hypothetical protein